jgi:hypothetical protein
MEYLIKTIVEKLETISRDKKTTIPAEKESRNNIMLESNKYSASHQNKKGSNCCSK